MRLTLKHGNRVLFMTSPSVVVPPDLASRVDVVSVADYESAELRRFRAVYRPWGLGEPWELNNNERYYVAYELMVRRKLGTIFYADSDVAVMTRLKPLGSECDAVLDLERNRGRMQVRVLESHNSEPLCITSRFLCQVRALDRSLVVNLWSRGSA